MTERRYLNNQDVSYTLRFILNIGGKYFMFLTRETEENRESLRS